MRRLVVLCAASVVIGGGAFALAGSSLASGSAPIIVCPLAAHSIIPCCGPPVRHAGSTDVIPPPLCCPPNAPCALALTVKSAPNPSTAGGRVTVSGRLSGSPEVGSPVVLWQRLPGRTGFQRVAQASAGTAGQFTIGRPAGAVETNRFWYVTAGGMRSRTVEQQVQATVTLTVAAPSAAPGQMRTFSGHVSPAHARQRVVLEQRSRRGWQPLARARLDRGSNFTLRHKFLHRGAKQVRAVFPGDSRNIRSPSAVVAIAVVAQASSAAR